MEAISSLERVLGLLHGNPFTNDYVARWQEYSDANLLPPRGAPSDRWIAWYRDTRTKVTESLGGAFMEHLGVGLAAGVGLQATSTTDDHTGLKELGRSEGVGEGELELAARATKVTRSLRGTAGSSEPMREVRRLAWAASFGESLHRVSELQDMIRRTPVLIQGETGTGKELIATAIGFSQPGYWSDGWTRSPYEPLHLGSIPSELVADALFGHEKGAFSGAEKEAAGALERCHGGAVFLDEIAELPHKTQVALLRCLQEGKVRRLGAQELTEAAPRLISATHEDLDRAVAENEFRADLLQRIRSVEIVIPPLRERLEDLSELVEKLLMTETTASSRGHLRTRVMTFIEGPARDYEWPGNVRELAAAIRSLSLGIQPRLRKSTGDTGSRSRFGPSQSPTLEVLAARGLSLREVERQYAQEAVAQAATKKEASNRLGIAPATLRNLLRESGDA